MDYCTEDGCDRPVFTKKSGFCQRHYDRARTARLAAARPAVEPVRDTPCRECGGQGYHRVDDGVLCQRHWDMLRRRGTTEPARAESKPDATCTVQDCGSVVHATGLCQPHYRQQRRRTLDPQVGQRKPGPAPREGATPHQRLTDEDKAARRAARKAAKTICVNNHELTEQNSYVTSKGQKVCRICTRNAQQRFHGRPETGDAPVGPRNAEKTHCKWGHEYAVHGRVKADGARMCVPCHRESTLMRTYDFARGQYDAMHAEQDGCCAICRRKLEEGKNLHVDHDHATGVVRGLLCTSCNNGLGRFDDDPALFDVAAAYIRRHRVDAKTS